MFMMFVLFTAMAAAETEADNLPGFYMFVQNAESGALAPVAGKENTYLLTLNNVDPMTIFFSDRPRRDVGQVPIEKFIPGLCFEEENPPNAAVEIFEGAEEADVVVGELRKPKYNKQEKTLQYEVRIIHDEATRGLSIYNKRKDKALPEKFGHVSLFIDDCPDKNYNCYAPEPMNSCGTLRVGTCWHWKHKPISGECRWCHAPYHRECDKKCGGPWYRQRCVSCVQKGDKLMCRCPDMYGKVHKSWIDRSKCKALIHVVNGTLRCGSQPNTTTTVPVHKCPYDCQAWNPASGSCVGAPRNGCGQHHTPGPHPAPHKKCPYNCQVWNPAAGRCVGAPMNVCKR